ncbi:MAG: GNAT family N-acetyltransferase [Bacteroidetes bacterium]|nr:MAG: GNAT family N-acetyltransferase [Bacteroidota bacterium]TDI72799.1 MAG: GNAT family N-acetyltransferase [Bacteroidota bacterium]
MKVITASSDHLQELVPLFDGYRIFYRQASNQDAVKNFLEERFQKKDSVIFIALDDEGNGLGFTQLYPSFSSVFMQRVYILNDLFVSEKARGQGIGEALIEYAKQFAREMGSKGLTLETAIDNPAQNLYKRLGWVKDTGVNHYSWEI